MRFIEDIQRRLLKHNKNWIGVITGETGSGKSYCGLRVGEQISPRFTINNVVFHSEDFMRLLNSGELEKGDCIVFDEAGVGMPAREWYSISNKLLMYILQTFRHKNLAIIFTTPSLDFIDVQARKLIHTCIETIDINRKHKYCLVKWLDMQYSSRFNKTYYKYRQGRKGNNPGKYYMTRIGMPSLNLIDDYEGKKRNYSRLLGIDAEKVIGETKKKLEPKPMLTIEQMAETFKGRKDVTISVIKNKYDIGEGRARQVRTMWAERASKPISE